ncbi:MAG: MBOAT family O-acyltransferase [Armatimonadota bacterium]
MLFNKIEFVIFAVLFFVGWRLLKGNRTQRWLFLIIASLFFYGWWDWRYVVLLIYTGLVDFSAGLAMERFPRHKKAFLVASMVGNIGTLAIFKYLGFATTTLNASLQFFGINSQLPVYNLILPVGISFYTFESLSYTVDVYKEHIKPTHNILRFFGFISLFPHLVAGPIIRPYDMMPQLDSDKDPTPAQKWDGMRLIAHGLFKKMVIADTIAPLVNAGFAQAALPESALYWWMITTMFAVQIYCDFSGYTDIARGLAKWMGYEFPLNFNHPYTSSSIREFWTRWHISLSLWFRDYLYIPLGGSRRGSLIGHRNLWVTMLVCGLWHGADWHFVIWGGLHAAYTSIERITMWPERLGRYRFGRVLSTVIVIGMVWVAWVFFRATDTTQAIRIVSIMFNPAAVDMTAVRDFTETSMFLVVMVMLREFYFYMRWDQLKIWENRVLMSLHPFGLAFTLMACVYFRGSGDAFIYFQF